MQNVFLNALEKKEKGQVERSADLFVFFGMRDSNPSENVLLALLNFTFRRGFLSRQCLEAPARSAHAHQAEGDLRGRTKSAPWLMESNSLLQILL